jgi:uncharacterized protein YegP (UPF0339 family)
MYQDKAEEWRWRFRAANGEPIADSGEGYKTKSSCEHGIELCKKDMPGAQTQYL